MSKHAQGSLQFPFEELLITYKDQPITCEGHMWIEFTAEYDGEQRTWDFDWEYAGTSDLTCYDSAGEIFPTQGIQLQLLPLVTSALDDYHDAITDRIHDSIACI